MSARSGSRPLMLFGMAVALVAHLWMLNDPMPAASGEMGTATSSATTVGAPQATPQPTDDSHGPDGTFMALTCLAVLMGAASAWLCLRTWRGKASGPERLSPGRRTSRPRQVLERPPPLPPPNRVEAGVLLLV